LIRLTNLSVGETRVLSCGGLMETLAVEDERVWRAWDFGRDSRDLDPNVVDSIMYLFRDMAVNIGIDRKELIGDSHEADRRDSLVLDSANADIASNPVVTCESINALSCLSRVHTRIGVATFAHWQW
jgi:hypothetical protein